MKTRVALIVLLFLLPACSRNVAVVAPPEKPASNEAIEIAYVGMPSVDVHQFARDSSAVLATYRYTETVSILARKPEWAKVRTLNGSGWMHSADLINAAEVEQALKNPSPRFLKQPETIPSPRARGEIAFMARVNTDGEVIDVQTLRNTTGSAQLATANAGALQVARFYPMLQKGQRVVFSYEHHVYY